MKPGGREEPASFALVSEDAATDAGIELVVGLRITRGVDEEMLRTVLSALGTGGC